VIQAFFRLSFIATFLCEAIMSEPVAEPKKAEESTDWDELSFLDDMELGEIDPESYQEQEDDGCEGGACKI
tara:strand:+ start:535 stop:747 length:213 start_codon:yes stop_codon:yes gene_type:complete